ncbi:MAG: phage head closure protein [Alphaproteobacteria bacterium]
MTPGDMRHRLVVEAPVEMPDGAGGVTRSYQAIATVWAEIEAVDGAERRLEDRLVQRNTFRITLRALAGLTAAHRFRKGDRIFDIHAIKELPPAGRYLQCEAEETTP